MRCSEPAIALRLQSTRPVGRAGDAHRSSGIMLMTFESVLKNFTTRGLRLDDVRRYLDGGGEIHHRDEKMHWSLLHLAAEDCNSEVIRLLVARGADIHARDRQGWTP